MFSPRRLPSFSQRSDARRSILQAVSEAAARGDLSACTEALLAARAAAVGRRLSEPALTEALKKAATAPADTDGVKCVALLIVFGADPAGRGLEPGDGGTATTPLISATVEGRDDSVGVLLDELTAAGTLEAGIGVKSAELGWTAVMFAV